eukprot:scaffold158828_cov32-Tisochrysis_lutea.AAC.3
MVDAPRCGSASVQAVKHRLELLRRCIREPLPRERRKGAHQHRRLMHEPTVWRSSGLLGPRNRRCKHWRLIGRHLVPQNGGIPQERLHERPIQGDVADGRGAPSSTARRWVDNYVAQRLLPSR